MKTRRFPNDTTRNQKIPRWEKVTSMSLKTRRFPNDTRRYQKIPRWKSIDHSIPRGSFLYYTSFQMPETPLTPTEHNFLQGSQVNHNTRDTFVEAPPRTFSSCSKNCMIWVCKSTFFHIRIKFINFYTLGELLVLILVFEKEHWKYFFSLFCQSLEPSSDIEWFLVCVRFVWTKVFAHISSFANTTVIKRKFQNLSVLKLYRES